MARRDGDVSGHLRRRSLVFPSQFWLLIGGTFLYLSGYDLCYPFETHYLHNRLGVRLSAIKQFPTLRPSSVKQFPRGGNHIIPTPSVKQFPTPVS